MRTLTTFAALLTVLMVAPRASRAQVDARGVSFGIGGGASLPVRLARNSYMSGFGGNAFVNVDLDGLPLALRADLTYQSFELRQAVIPPAGRPGAGTGTLLGGLGDVQLYVTRRGTVRPYLITGFGAYSVKTEYDADGLPGLSETRLGAHGGAGLLLTFGSLNLYAEGTLDHLFERTGTSPEPAVDVVPLTLGVIF